jgi:hydrogenase large subunit
MLVGKAPLDALVIVPRVCGICSASQSFAAARALGDAIGVAPPPNGRHAANLVVACENLADLLTHFYLFFMPDLARPEYEGRPWWPRAAARFRAACGTAASEALAARAGFLGVMGLLAGRWPHTLSLQPGGTSCAAQAGEKIQLQLVLRAFRAFLERTLFGDALERIGALDSTAALDAWAAARSPAASDLAAFLEISRDLGLDRIGRATDVFLAYGAYPQEGGWVFPRGVHDGRRREVDPSAIAEDPSHAFLAGDRPLHPAQGETIPEPDRPGAYSWCKAPRLGGEVVEVGPLARQVVAGHPLARDLVARGGASVHARIVARLLELAVVVPRMEEWVRALEPGGPYHTPAELPGDADGAGLVEAARGALGHWVSIRGGRIARYQIVAPTTWNFSPRDARGRPGPLERALVGVAAGAGTVAVQHVVRSFDPCMVCTVH